MNEDVYQILFFLLFHKSGYTLRKLNELESSLSGLLNKYIIINIENICFLNEDKNEAKPKIVQRYKMFPYIAFFCLSFSSFSFFFFEKGKRKRKRKKGGSRHQIFV